MPFNLGPGEIILMVIIALMIAVPVWLLISLGKASARGSHSTSADSRVVLADRLARGEISQADFDTAMRALGFID